MPAGTRRDRLVIGLTGSFGSGCSTVAGILTDKHGFHSEGLSGAIREEAKKHGERQDRRVLQDLGDELRKRHGTGWLATQAARAAQKSARESAWVLDGIRNLGEVSWLRSQFPNFYMIAVNASRDVRYARLRNLYRKNEAAFDEDDARDRGEPYAYGQQVSACVDRADVLLLNEEDFSTGSRPKRELGQKIADLVRLMTSPGSRLPSPRELLMHLAYSVSLRSSCLKRQVGAIIVGGYGRSIANSGRGVGEDSESVIVAAGYNEVPSGQERCRDKYDGKCYRDYQRELRIEELRALKLKCECGRAIGGDRQCQHCGRDLTSLYAVGKALDYCRALHAEETAILQGSRTGGPTLPGTVLYATTFPCLLCAKKIVYTGIKEVVYVEAYPVKEAAEFLKDAGVVATRFEGVKAQAFYKLFKAMSGGV